MPTKEEGEELLAAVEWWQNNPRLHPLTCEEHSDTPLRAWICPASYKVSLYCEEEGCPYSQHWIPDVVLDAYRNRTNIGG